MGQIFELPEIRGPMALVVHINQHPYGKIQCPLVFRKIPKAKRHQLRVHLAVVEKVDISGAQSAERSGCDGV